MIRLVTSIYFLLFSLVLTAQYEFAISQAEKLAQSVLNDDKLPGITVGVSSGDDFEWYAGFGYTNVEDQTSVDPKASLFRVGSVSKSFTGVGLMRLYQEQKIDIDAEIQDYVPSFPNKKYKTTVRQVARHTAGIRHYKGREFMSNEHYSTVEEGLVIFKDDPLEFEPDTKYSYSSYGWNLISAAMETAANQEFLSYMEEHVFRPAGMVNTRPDDVNVDYPERVTFYYKDYTVAPDVDNSYKWAGGGFLSTAQDLIQFGKALLNNSLITEETLQEALITATLKDGSETNRGVGFANEEDKKGRVWYGHSGGSVGGSTMFIVYPEQKLCVAVMINQSSAPAGNLAFRIAEQFISNPADK